jgi:hypothetical protein
MDRRLIDKRDSSSTEEREIVNNIYAIAPNVWRMKDVFVNVFIIESREQPGWVLVDTGLKSSYAKIKNMIAEVMEPGAIPQAILMTHGHFDHRGALQQLAAEWKCLFIVIIWNCLTLRVKPLTLLPTQRLEVALWLLWHLFTQAALLMYKSICRSYRRRVSTCSARLALDTYTRAHAGTYKLIQGEGWCFGSWRCNCNYKAGIHFFGNDAKEGNEWAS